MIILSFDPGGTTGIAIKLAAGDGSLGTLRHDHYITENERDPYQTLQRIIDYMPDVVVMEQFQTMHMISSHGLRTVELVGMIQAICWHLKIPCYRHTPQQRYPFIAAATRILEAKGEKFTDHEQSALAHLLYYEKHGK